VNPWTTRPDGTLLIRDIMTRQLITVDASASAEEAAWALTRRHIGGAPARDDDGNLVGMLSKSDLVDPEPRQWIRKEATVADVMNPDDLVTLYANDPAMAAVKEMAQREIHRIVVLDEDSKPVGIVTPMDVVRALHFGARFEVS
jgi:CBS-domain-containing membrane protein